MGVGGEGGRGGGGATKYFAKISESVKIHPTLKCSIKRGPEKEQINI